MARPVEERGYFVRKEDPETPIHGKVSKSDGLVPISIEQARALAATKRARNTLETLAPVFQSSADTEAIERAFSTLEQFVRDAAGQQVDLAPIQASIDDHERRIGVLEQDRETAGVGYSTVASDVSTAGAVEQPAPPPPPDAYETGIPGHIRGDWRAAALAVDEAEGPEEDFGIGMDIEPEVIPEGVPLPDGIEDYYEGDEMRQEVQQAPPRPTQHIAINEQRTITDERMSKIKAAYEVALQAMNGSLKHQALLVGPAERRGCTVDELIGDIVAKHDAMVQNVMSEF